MRKRTNDRFRLLPPWVANEIIEWAKVQAKNGIYEIRYRNGGWDFYFAIPDKEPLGMDQILEEILEDYEALVG